MGSNGFITLSRANSPVNMSSGSALGSWRGSVLVGNPCVGHIRLLYTATTLTKGAGLSRAIRDQLRGIGSHLLRLVFHVVSRARL
jgi:hypothetical protein